MPNKKYIINNDCLFDPVKKHLVSQLDESTIIALGKNESDILLTLIERRSEILSKEALNQLVWSDKGIVVDESSVIQSISTLRKVLKDSVKEPSFILTVPRKGYQFIGSADELIDEPESLQVPENTTAYESKKSESSVKRNRIINQISVLSLFILLMLASVYIASNLSINNDINLTEVDHIKGVSVYAFGGQDSVYSTKPRMKRAVEKFINESGQVEEVEKIIVNLTSKGHVVINVMYSELVRNTSYIVRMGTIN